MMTTTTISIETAATKTKTVWSPSTVVAVPAPTAKQKPRQSILDVTIPAEQARTKFWSISSSSSSSSSQMTRMDSVRRRFEPPKMWSSSSSLKSSSSTTDTLTSLSSTTTTTTTPSLSSSSSHEDHHPLPSMMMIQPHYHLHRHRCSTFDQQGVVVLGASGTTWAKRRRKSPETMRQNCGCYHQQQHYHPTILNSIDSCGFCCCHCGYSSTSSSSWSWSSSSSSLSSGALHHPSSSSSNFHHHHLHHCHHHCGQYHHNQGLIKLLLKSISKAGISTTIMANMMLWLMIVCLLLFLWLLLTRAILLVHNTVTLSLLLILSYLKNRQHLRQHPNKFSNNHHHHHHHHAATRMLKKIIILMAIINCLMIVAQANANDSQNENKDGAGSEHEPDNKSDAYSDAGSNITRILNAFFDSGYDKRVRPEYGGPPVQVGVTMHVIGISSVSEVQMDFTSDFYFRQLWKDNRLAFTPVGGIDNLVVGAEVAQKIWVPDTFFANEKVASFHSATTPNTFLRILSTGEVYRSIRLTVTASCPMNLQYFPMDSQLCSIEIESYGYSMADIIYIWAKGKESIGMSKGLELPQFKVVGYRQSMKIETLSTGNYSRLVCEIQFERSMGYYLIQIYIPASLIVIISWVSFWLHRNATPARVALGVTTVLTMTTLMSSTNAALPKISYIKSIDVFLGTCFVMVFASLLEYASVGYLGKRIAMRKTRSQQLAKLAQEHRNRCAAAAAAAAAAATGATPRSCSINMNLSGANSMANNGQQPQSMDDNDDGCGGGMGQSSEPSDGPPSSIPPPIPMPGGPGSMMCQQTDLSATLHRPLKPIPIHQTMERMDRYATIGTPRIVHHPSMNCPPTCPQAYARQDVRLNRATPILSGPECAQASRKSFSGKSTYSMGSGHHLPDSPINGSGACSMIPPPPGPMGPTGMLGPHCSQQPLPMQHHPQSQQPSTSSPTINLHKRHHHPHHPQHLSDSGLGPDGDNISMGGGPTPPVQPHPMPPPPHPPTGGGGGGLHFGSKNPNKLFGVSPSDIDKYSRVVFPVCFVCFNLMYWVIYLHISSQMIEDLIPAQ